jgi:hypothetical protein
MSKRREFKSGDIADINLKSIGREYSFDENEY